MDRAGDSRPQGARLDMFFKSHAPAGYGRNSPASAKLRRQAPGREQARQFALQRALHNSPLQGFQRKSIEDQALDVQMDFHATAPCFGCHRKSSSLIGRSSLRNSVRAASNTSGIVTGSPECAARKAAFKAML